MEYRLAWTSKNVAKEDWYYKPDKKYLELKTEVQLVAISMKLVVAAHFGRNIEI